MATAATKYDDMNIDWDKVHDGDKPETQRAVESVENLCWWMLDQTTPQWRDNPWDEEDIKQELRMNLLMGARIYDPKQSKWRTYAIAITRNIAREVWICSKWPLASNYGQARYCNEKSMENPEAYEMVRLTPISLDAPLGSDEGSGYIGDLLPGVNWEDAVCEQLDLLQMSTAILSNAQLSRLEWVVLQAWCIRDMPWAKIASQYGIECKQIDNALQRAKRKLRKTHMEMAAC